MFYLPQHEQLKDKIEELKKEQIIPNPETIECIKKELSSSIQYFEELDKTNKKSVESLSKLSNQHTILQILQKYLQCGFKIENCIIKLNATLEKENEIWKKLIASVENKTMKNYKSEWINKVNPIFNTIENVLQQLTHIKDSLQKIQFSKPFKLLNFLNNKHQEFIKEIKLRIKERLEILFSIFKWPTANHKLAAEIKPLGFTNDKMEDLDWINIHPINEIIREHSHFFIDKIDSRLELFVAMFIFGYRLQIAFGQIGIHNIWVLDTLYAPIITRFQFHFMSKESSTNLLDKPEWVVTFIGNTLADHAEFLLNYIQPILNRESKTLKIIPDAKNILINKLLEIHKQKLIHDIPILLLKNQSLYCHTISETVKLEKLLFNVHNYPIENQSPMEVFAFNDEFFDAWIQIENYGKFFYFLSKFCVDSLGAKNTNRNRFDTLLNRIKIESDFCSLPFLVKFAQFTESKSISIHKQESKSI